jgi:hypothetical protein
MIQYFLYGMLAGIGLVGLLFIIAMLLLNRDTKPINDKDWEA